ncbi:acyl-CoA synthetase FdrA [Sphaerochaeta sp. UBA5849]|jgi:succinyl-CoA synthetase alpha subunit|uniref:DUF1116 domain-containing protein n=1 Tax=Sphaerochaeta sp. UBA5849 TaxID=1947475 RepID=UPI0031F4F3CF
MKQVVVKKDMYVDSVVLMLLSRDLETREEIESATVAMGTAMNVQLLIDQGYSPTQLEKATPSDLLIALDCPEESDIPAMLAFTDTLLSGKGGSSKAEASQEAYCSVEDVVRSQSETNLAIISVPGIYAAHEARKALDLGLNVMIFSDNVALEDEIDLKQRAVEKGLLVMGPDCGTAIIGGKPLCFANVVAPGSIGLVAASGTGLQEVTCLLDRMGCGISQAIGTGGRDLKNKAVGGRMMLQGIRALGEDPNTDLIVVVSKPPTPELVPTVLNALVRTQKNSVVHFIGADAHQFPHHPLIHWASNLEETARIAASLSGKNLPKREHYDDWPFDLDHETIDAIVLRESKHRLPEQTNIRGYYTGGTLCDEAWLSLSDLKENVYSNNQTNPALRLLDPHVSIGHTIVDLGDDVFTVGRPHPMIDPTTRTDRIRKEMDDASIAVMVLDCVLGYGSCDDPAGAMIPTLVAAKQAALKRGGYLSIVASVTGTPLDPQGFALQVQNLEKAGVVVMPSNYQAVKLAQRILLKQTGVGNREESMESPSQITLKPLDLPDATPVGPILSLFEKGVHAVNLGLASFSKNLESCGADVYNLDWKPPAGGDVVLIDALNRMDTIKDIDCNEANQEAVERVLASKPMLLGIAKAKDVIPGMRENLLLHAGPPITWERMCGPMRGAVIGALLYEGKAKDANEAEKLASSGAIEFEPCHHHNAVGPMAGIISCSMPVWIVENDTYKNKAYATLNEGLGKVLRYGAYNEEVLSRLHWMESILAPILNKALQLHGPIDMRSLIVQALQMGDEGHNRNRAGTSLVIRELAPYLVLLDEPKQHISDVLTFMHKNDHFFLNLSMPSAKCTMDSAKHVKGSTLITAMARNGTDFGIQISGLADRWFTAGATVVEGLYLPGFKAEDAALDIGDSVITETSGIGGFAMAASPSIVKFVGGTPSDAIMYTKRMYNITLAENREYRIPILDFRGTPTGIDVRKVVEKGILPVINTGIAHKEPGIGMVGAGLVKPPIKCFQDALLAFADEYAPSDHSKKRRKQ